MDGNFENDKSQNLKFYFMKISLGVLISICLFSIKLIAAERSRDREGTIINDFFDGFGPKAICTATNLRIREKPLVKCRTIGILRKGQIVNVNQSGFYDTIDNIGSEWVLIKSSEGIQGWVFGGYLEDLFSAIRKEDCDSLKKLLEAGADPNLLRKIVFSGLAGGGPPMSSPLLRAVGMGSLKMVKILLPYINDVNLGYYSDSELEDYPPDEKTPLERAKEGANPHQEIIFLLEAAQSRQNGSK